MKLPFYDIVYHTKIQSTQKTAKRLADAGRKQGTLITCKKQSEGYGRLGRAWVSPEGGIWFSLILRPEIPPDAVPQVTLVISVSICHTLERVFGLKPKLKWPNDIYLGDKKLAGIITEMSAKPGQVNWVVTGVGLNVNNKVPPNAVSIKDAIGKEVKLNKLLIELLADFSVLYKTFCKEGFSPFLKDYTNRSILKGKTISIDTGSGIVTGKFKRIDNEGYLWVESKGKSKKIISGDIQ